MGGLCLAERGRSQKDRCAAQLSVKQGRHPAILRRSWPSDRASAYPMRELRGGVKHMDSSASRRFRVADEPRDWEDFYRERWSYDRSVLGI